jgi:site-specific DNA-methyltransferase (adenine-specific)
MLNPADAVVTDPPYNVGVNYGPGTNDRNPDYFGWLASVLSLCADASRDPVIFFPGVVNAFQVAAVLDKAGLRGIRLLGWHKREFAGDMWRGGPAICWEPIVWASRAEKPFFNTLFGHWGRDFCVVPSTHGDPLKASKQRPNGHPCPKPLMVMRWLIGLFVPQGGLVADPFCGTGPTLLAAKESGRRAIGIEIEERYCEIAAKRLRQEVLAL